jgi:hypothetical protein
MDGIPEGGTAPVHWWTDKPDLLLVDPEEVDQLSLRMERRHDDRRGLADRPSNVRVASEHPLFKELRVSNIRQVVYGDDARDISERWQ